VLVIGGGATGLPRRSNRRRAVIARRCRAGGFAQATSSRSTKLIHGGVRYLQQGRVSLVREALRERAHLLANAPASRPSPAVHPAALQILGAPFLRRRPETYDMLASESRSVRPNIFPVPKHSNKCRRSRPQVCAAEFCITTASSDDARLAITFAQNRRRFERRRRELRQGRPLLKNNGRVCGVMGARR